MLDWFALKGHHSLSFPVSPKSSSELLRRPNFARHELSLLPSAVKFEAAVCKTPKALPGLDQRKEPAELLGVLLPYGWVCVCLSVCMAFGSSIVLGGHGAAGPMGWAETHL